MGRKAESKLAANVLAETAPGKVLAHRLARLGLPEVALVERGRLLEQRVQPLGAAAACVRLRRGRLVLERDPVAVGEPLDRAREVEVLRLADEGDDVAGGRAAEAVVQALLRADREARRPFLVERAAAGEPRARLAQLRPRRNDVDEIGRGLDRLDGRILDPG